ncbi:MAG: hypothetical protein EBZ62_06500 [Sphingobacteriia bacterium]|nr:hypothetical protein [Sphingobacteriia bacterium]
MDQELQNQLFEKYPTLFINKDKGIQSSCMAWGCECGNGWYDILSSLCWMIVQHENSIEDNKKYLEKNNPEKLKGLPEYFPVKFDQIKEKYGGLRVYFSGGDEYTEGLVSMAEAMSYKICEACGNQGYSNEGGWITTLCDSCRDSNA